MDNIRDIKFLQTSSGRVPFYDWYNSLTDKQTRRIIAGKLRQLQNASFRNYKGVGGGVFEFRIFHGPGYRIYFAFDNETIVVVIGGGDKATQEQDIEQAIFLWREYKNAA